MNKIYILHNVNLRHKFYLPLEFLSQGHSGGGKLDGVDGVAHEDPDV